jgi:hypothetical protein
VRVEALGAASLKGRAQSIEVFELREVLP